jgi:hypothetical protein
MNFRLLGLLASLGLTSCIDTDTAIFVEPSIENPSLTVVDGPLGATLGGSFDVVLHLGARASGPSETEFVSFSVKSADESEVLVENLPVSASASLPVTVEPGGEDVIVSFEIAQEGDVLDPSLVDALCAGNVVFSVVIEDSLSTTSTPVISAPLQPGGCL